MGLVQNTNRDYTSDFDYPFAVATHKAGHLVLRMGVRRTARRWCCLRFGDVLGVLFIVACVVFIVWCIAS